MKNKFNVVDCKGILARKELEEILNKLPVRFLTTDKDTFNNEYEKSSEGYVNIYHTARVISIHPPEGKRLYCATLLDMDFPLRPDNIMDDQIGLRSCFHPKL